MLSQAGLLPFPRTGCVLHAGTIVPRKHARGPSRDRKSFRRIRVLQGRRLRIAPWPWATWNCLRRSKLFAGSGSVQSAAQVSISRGIATFSRKIAPPSICFARRIPVAAFVKTKAWPRAEFAGSLARSLPFRKRDSELAIPQPKGSCRRLERLALRRRGPGKQLVQCDRQLADPRARGVKNSVGDCRRRTDNPQLTEARRFCALI